MIETAPLRVCRDTHFTSRLARVAALLLAMGCSASALASQAILAADCDEAQPCALKDHGAKVQRGAIADVLPDDAGLLAIGVGGLIIGRFVAGRRRKRPVSE